MGSTNKTDIGLSQFILGDEPSWMSDYNRDMLKITENINGLHNATATVIAGRLNMLEEQTVALTDAVHTNTSDIAVNTSSIAANKVLIEANTTHIDAVDSREQGHYDTLSKQVDGQIASLEEFRDKQTYFEQNMNKTEAEVTILTASVAANRVAIENVSRETNQNSDDIGLLTGNVDDAIAKVDAMETQVRNNTTNIAANSKNIESNTSSIAATNSRVKALEDKSPQTDTNTADITTLKTDVANLQYHAKTDEEDIDNLQAVTANVQSGVTVPFGFGETADGERGWKDTDGTIQPFLTSEEHLELMADIASNLSKINELIEKTKNLMNGAALPFSLGIADSGAYGYIKNGEYGVTPWVTENAVKSIVDIKPLEANIQTLSGNVDTLVQTAENLEQNVTTLSSTVDAMESGKASAQSVTALTQTVSGHTDSIESLKSNVDALKTDKADKTDGSIDAIEGSFIQAGADSTRPYLSSGFTVATGGSRVILTKYPGKVGVKELWIGNNNADVERIKIPFSLGVDANGNYGYVKAGADTVTPFLSKSELSGGSASVIKISNNIACAKITIRPDMQIFLRFVNMENVMIYASDGTMHKISKTNEINPYFPKNVVFKTESTINNAMYVINTSDNNIVTPALIYDPSNNSFTPFI